MKTINIIFLFLIIIFIFIYILNKKKEDFIDKIKLDKKIVIVILDKKINIKDKMDTIKNICNKVIKDCKVDYNEEKANNKKTISITHDTSNKTKYSKNKVYIIIGKNKNNKKWKEQENVIFVDYKNVDPLTLYSKLSNLIKIDIPLSDLLSFNFNTKDII